MIAQETYTPSQFIREYTPFRLWVLSIEEYKEKKTKFFNRYGVLNKMDYFWEDNSDTWICIFFVGRGIPFANRNYRSDDYDITIYGNNKHDEGWTYWYVKSKDRPSVDCAINSLFLFLEDYNSENIVEHLKRMRDEWLIDLNKVDVDKEEQYLYYNGRLSVAINELVCSGRWRCTRTFDQKSYRTLSTYSFEKLLKNYREYVEY